MLFNVWNVAIFPLSEKLLMESHLDIAYIAGSKQHIGNPSFEATRCRDTSLIVIGNTEFFLGGGGGRRAVVVRRSAITTVIKRL